MLNRLVSQLAHFAVTTHKPAESLAFYRDVIGLEVSGQEGQSAYLRGWGESFRHSLHLVEGDGPGLAHIGWRAFGPEQLEEAVRRIEATGRGEGWVPPAFGRGRAYRYRGPGGHLNELFWEVERYQAPDAMQSGYPSRPQRYVPRGVAARCLDHLTVNTTNIRADAEWYRDTLGHRWMEYIVADDDPSRIIFATTTTGERGHDLGLVPDMPGNAGRINHIAFWTEQREELRRAADVLMDNGAPVEFGPGRHGVGEQDYLYCREPSGLRVELNAGGYRNAEPDWQTVEWTVGQGGLSFYKNVTMPHSMFESFPAPVNVDDHAVARTRAETTMFV